MIYHKSRLVSCVQDGLSSHNVFTIPTHWKFCRAQLFCKSLLERTAKIIYKELKIKLKVVKRKNAIYYGILLHNMNIEKKRKFVNVYKIISITKFVLRFSREQKENQTSWGSFDPMFIDKLEYSCQSCFPFPTNKSIHTNE